MNVYVVMGSTGEYSDRREWPVRAFLDETAAQALVVVATDRTKELGLDPQNLVGDYNELETKARMNEHDPHMTAYYTGTTYSYMVVPLVGADETVSALVDAEAVNWPRKRVRWIYTATTSRESNDNGD